MPTVTHPQRASYLDDDPRWSAVLQREAAADGRFVFGVLTTGIYCRPSCPARRPRPENARFFASGIEAGRAGFRPCLRCRPDGVPVAAERATLVAQACAAIAAAESPPSLADLAAQAGLSPFHFHRVFKAATGVTPRAYAAARRGERLQAALAAADTSITAAGYAAGFNSSARLHAAAGEMLGMTPRRFRAGGTRERIRFAVAPCDLGSVLVAATERGLCAITLGDDAEILVQDLRSRFPKADLVAGDGDFAGWVTAVVGLVAAPSQPFALPLDVVGTAFQRQVWEALRAIPPGQTASYTAVANAIGQPRAARAVARACAGNPLAVAVPCHRVVGAGGALSGYRWGVARKRALLAREERTHV